MKLNWVKTIYGDGRGYHVGSVVKWQGAYHISFVEGTGHGTEDSQIMIARSTDLENWTFHVAMTPTCIDPKLLVIGDRLYVYAVKVDLDAADDRVGPSWQMFATSEDGQNWSAPKRCYLMNRDFWQPVAFNGKYYVVADTAGHVPTGLHNASDLLSSDDGEHWTWVSEILQGGTEYDDVMHNERFVTPASSETALHFFDDGRLLAITRARGHTAALSLADPPYETWEHRRSEESRCYGAAVARVGEHIIATGRSFDNEGQRATTNNFPGEEGARTGVFLYADGEITLQMLLPSGSDTGYAGILGVSDTEALIAYYSAHEHIDPPGSNVYLASVSLED